MARTLNSLVLSVLKELSGHEEYVSRGELYQLARAQGYKGEQENLINRAVSMANSGIIDGRKMGMSHNMRFRYKVTNRSSV